ncbi:MAG: hypothetical protein IT168_24145 [Bryobacterales bacterium]|nr:hypothetical protein [Bryobacterales bacterium]
MTTTPKWRLVLIGGVVAGAIDMAYAIAFWAIKANLPATRILQSVAAGLLGESSFKGGWRTAILGLLLHVFIAISMAFAYYEAAKRLPALHSHPVVFGALYGGALYFFMNWIVIPLSATSRGSPDPLWIG